MKKFLFLALSFALGGCNTSKNANKAVTDGAAQTTNGPGSHPG